MRVVNGKHICQMNTADVTAWAQNYKEIAVDLGAGDGRFVRNWARENPAIGAIGVDLCEKNLRDASRAANGNALFVVADALAVPAELSGVATRVTINFPWGSLLRGLLSGHPGLMAGLNAIGIDGASLEIVLNAGALADAGRTLEDGCERVKSALRDAGASIGDTTLLGPAELRRWPTTWAKRLAFGRDPRAVRIEALLPRRGRPGRWPPVEWLTRTTRS